MAGDLINGEIPAHWEFTTLGEICQRGGGNIQSGPFGSQLHASDYVPVGVPSIMPTNIGENRIVEDGIVRITEEDANRLSQHRLRAGDIIYSRRGDVEKRALIREREEGWFCGTGCLKVRLGRGIVDPLFASLFLGHPAIREWIVRHAVGATMPNLNTAIMSAVPFALPPLAEQKAIAAVLGALDDKIELNRRMNATLESMARALFQSWFVDFDPVRAKLDGRKPAGMDDATAALFPDRLEDSPLGHIPKGWHVCSLADKIELLSGGTPKTSKATYWDGDIPWYSVKDAPLETDMWVIRTEKHVTKEGIANSAAQILPEGTTIISARGTVGKLALIGTPMAMNQSCYGVRGTKGSGDFFTYFVLRQATAELQQRTHGTVFDTITRQTFETLDCIFPPANLTAAFDRTVAPLLSQIRANLHQSCTLATLRDTLLPRLLNGELRVN
jgi:type I restriction enzyme S subunit